jgi:hypothetical protein
MKDEPHPSFVHFHWYPVIPLCSTSISSSSLLHYIERLFPTSVQGKSYIISNKWAGSSSAVPGRLHRRSEEVGLRYF